MSTATATTVNSLGTGMAHGARQSDDLPSEVSWAVQGDVRGSGGVDRDRGHGRRRQNRDRALGRPGTPLLRDRRSGAPR